MNSNKGTVVAALIAPAFALALPIVDVSLAVLRRGLRGLPIFRPDQRHIHHRLLTLGISRERTLLNLYTVSLLCLTLAVCVFCVQGRLLPLYIGLLFGGPGGRRPSLGLYAGLVQHRQPIGDIIAFAKRDPVCVDRLDRWFVMAADRHRSMETLREDYWFVVRKLGFSKVNLSLPGVPAHAWEGEEFDAQKGEYYRAVHEISDGTTIEFVADKKTMSEDVFVLLGDLASESWYKAASRCRSDAKSTDVDDLHKTSGPDKIVDLNESFVVADAAATGELLGQK